jgi:hypothetical protein
MSDHQRHGQVTHPTSHQHPPGHVLMSDSTMIVAANAQLLRRLDPRPERSVATALQA